MAGAILVWAFFAAVAGDQGFLTRRGTAAYLEVSAELGILAVTVALLMVAGEFDLSVGSIIGATGMLMALLTVEAGWPVWGAIAAAVALALAIGLLNGLVVVRTGLPSFIVTLGTLFIFRGATIAVTREVTGRTQLSGVSASPGYDLAHGVFASQVGGFSISILWWLGITLLATWVLLRARSGNWIFGSGGAPEAARYVGVPVNRVKVVLFMTTALGACLVAIIQVIKFNGADVLRGEFREFEAIIAAVIGGTLLTGGYGSAIGAAFGALLFGMVRLGIFFTRVDTDWFQVFLGAMLLVAVLFNNYVRRKAAESRR